MERGLTRILKRFSKIEFKYLLSKWGKMPVWKIDYTRTKYEIIQQICVTAQECHLKMEDVFYLELLYVIENTNKKNWRAIKMNKPLGLSLDDENFEASAFKKCLKQKLFPTSCDVQVEEQKSALWGRISRLNSVYGLFFVHFPYSPYVLVTNSSLELTSLFMKALCFVVGYSDFEPIELVSNHPESLAQILLHTQNPNEAYTYDKGTYKPLPRHEDTALHRFDDTRLEICHMNRMVKTQKIVKQQFTEKLQPKIPFVNVMTTTRFRGKRFIPTADDFNLECCTCLSGNDVLEGLRKLTLLGLTHGPLPKFLTSIGRTGLQNFKITDRRAVDTDRSSA
ncbi:centromere protein N-A-like isoform X1 [Clavelina lepadiformis]|uniref:centromere protein N-A-like isoform X1 n=1 Tax=Clavelina lepadiformis TaxID=159417 RepID=UPI004043727D